MEVKVQIKTEYITLGQLLKLTQIISSGGEEKQYIASHNIKVNGEGENRRGRKLRNNDKVEVDGKTLIVCSSVISR
jgi:S4 domain protein YaaA